jgi:hypothetical protein
VSPEDKAKLLKLIEACHTPEAACSALGLPLSDVAKPGPRLAAAIQAAESVGLARLKSKVMDLALEGNNVQALERELERREAKTLGTKGIERIERIVIFKCERCGHEPNVMPKGGQSRPLNSDRPKPGNGAVPQ